MIGIELVYNLALLVALSVVSSFIMEFWRRGHLALLQGFLFGVVAVVGMLNPLLYGEGLFFDGRSIIISLCAFFFGPLAVTVTAGMVIAGRFLLGGVGAFAGSLGVLSAAAIGIYFYYRHYRKEKKASFATLLLLGILVSAAMLSLMFFLPGGKGFDVVKKIGIPILLFYPLATVFIGKILSDMVSRNKLLADLRTSENIFQQFMEHSPIYVFFKDDHVRSLRLSKNYESMLGRPIKDLLGKNMEELFPSDFAKKMVADDLRVLKEGKRIEITEEFNGRSYITIKFPIMNDAGVPSYLAGFTIDITDLKNTEQSLKEREGLLQKIFDILPVGLWFTDKEGKLLKGNPEGIRIWGTEPKVSPEQYGVFKARRLPSGQEIAPDDWALAHTIRDKATIQDELLEFDAFDGQKRVVLNYTAPVLDDDGSLLSAIVVNKDITDRYRVEEKLRESEERFRSLFEQAADIIFLLEIVPGNVPVIRDVNKRVSQILGYEREELINRPISFIEDKAGDAVLIQERQRILRSGNDPVLMVSHRCKDGSIREFECSIKEMWINSKLFAVSVERDVTEKKRLEQSLRESERSLRATIDGLSSHIAVLDEEGTILLTNKAWREFAEENDMRADMVSEGSNYLKICDGATGEHAQEAAPFAQGIRDVLGGKSDFFSMEYPCNSPEKARWFVGRVTVFPGVDPRRVVIAHENYTKRKLLELEREDLIAALKHKNDEMEGMLYASSHDLRTPLVSIVGFNGVVRQSLDELKELMGSDLPMGDMCAAAKPHIAEKIPMAVEYIGKSAEKMQRLVDGILKLSRLGRAEHLPETVNMKALMACIVEPFKFPLQAAGGTIALEELPSCWGDSRELEQAFTNLIDNALKYRDPARPPLIRISATADDRSVTYCIEDNGIGIKPEHRDQIWGLFSRLDPNGPVAGEGLGLALVQRIVQRNHGKISVEGEPGHGARFLVSLPRDHGKSKKSH